MKVYFELLYAGKNAIYEKVDKIKTDKVKSYVYNFLELRENSVEQHKYFSEQDFDLSNVKLLDLVDVALDIQIGSEYSKLLDVKAKKVK